MTAPEGCQCPTDSGGSALSPLSLQPLHSLPQTAPHPPVLSSLLLNYSNMPSSCCHNWHHTISIVLTNSLKRHRKTGKRFSYTFVPLLQPLCWSSCLFRCSCSEQHMVCWWFSQLPALIWRTSPFPPISYFGREFLNTWNWYIDLEQAQNEDG